MHGQWQRCYGSAFMRYSFIDDLLNILQSVSTVPEHMICLQIVHVLKKNKLCQDKLDYLFSTVKSL